MPTRHREQILLPRAINTGRSVIATRQFDITLFAKTQNYYKLVRIEKIQYAPSWPKVEAKVFISGIEQISISGDGGIIPLEVEFSNFESANLALFNNSMDTETRFTIFFVGWQEGE